MTLAILLLSLLPLAAPQAPALEMKTYQMVLLRKGPQYATANGPDAQKRQEAHLANLTELNRKRINLLYGPLLDDGDLRGIAVLDVPSADEARKLFADDPHVKAGALTGDVKPWMAPKGWFQPPADPQGLEHLVLGFLVRGSNTTQDRAASEEIQKGHLAYMAGLNREGKLVAAGPFLDDAAWRGVVIYRVANVEEAKALAAGDPAVKAGRLALEAHPWMTLKGILK